MIKIVMTYSNTTENTELAKETIKKLEADFDIIIRSKLQNNRSSSKKHFVNLELETKNNNL